MGNFGKRLLFVTLAVLVVVLLAVGGNAYQNRNKDHKVSKGSEVVYSGTYEGTSYEVTKSDIWKNILYSSPMSTIDEMIDKYLLKSYIDNQSDEAIAKKINYLIYGTNDDNKIAEAQENEENNQKLILSFKNKLAVLGYKENGDEGHSINDYARLMLAYDDYAAYRLENGLKIGTLEADLSDEALTEAFKDEYKDTLAITIRFNSEDESTDFYKSYKLAVVSSRFRLYIGDSKYQPAKNDDGSFYLDDELNPVLLTKDVEDGDGNTITVKVPRGNLKVENNDYIWDNTRPAWTIDGDQTQYHWVLSSDTLNDEESYADNTGLFVSSAVEYADQSSFTTSNTAYISASNYLTLYAMMYNKYYSQLRNAIPTSVTLNDFYNAFSFTVNGGLISDADKETLNAALKLYNLVLVSYTVGDQEYQEIRKYVGNEDYIIKTDENGEAVGKDGFATYKEYDDSDIPNYKILKDENGDPILDFKGNFQYYLDENGERVLNDERKSIDEQTSFTLENTIAPNQISLYAAYINAYFDYTYEGYSEEYKALCESLKDNLLYNYDEISAKRSDVAKQIFTTLTFDETIDGGYLLKPTSMTAANSSETPYYMIFKLGSSKKSNPSQADLNQVKADLIQSYLETAGVPAMAVAELRAEAGLTVYDEFLGYEYESIIGSDSDHNSYGVSEYEDYYKAKAYKNKKLAALTKKVEVNGTTLDKLVITSDDLYDYSMKASASTYISTAALNKVLLSMNEFEIIHGKSDNYLTSKNWKMKEYASATQSYNYYYEYYKSIYAQYGYSYYDSVEEFLFAYGSRNFDDMVVAFERGTMRNIFLYNTLVGSFFDNNDSGYVSTLSIYSTSATKGNDTYLFHGDDFTSLYDDYFDSNVYHVLFYVDFNEDGSPDDYDDFLKTFDETTGISEFIKDENGDYITLADWNKLLSSLENDLYKYINEKEFSIANISTISSFITDYNNASILNSDYAQYKKVGIMMEYESLGEVNSSNVSNYVERFGEGVRTVYEKLERVDNKLLGYSMSDSLTQTEFGLHLIIESAGSNFDKINFKYTDNNNSYSALARNENEKISDSQIALYILQVVYTNIYGDTDNPEENAGFNYPSIPDSVSNAINAYHSSYFNKVLDLSNTYHSNYIILQKLASETSEYQEDFAELRDIYYSILFGELA